MGFNPLEEKGTPMEKQFKNWSELNVQPYNKNEVHPYTRTRCILMNGIEVEAALFSHQFAPAYRRYGSAPETGLDPPGRTAAAKNGELADPRR